MFFKSLLPILLTFVFIGNAFADDVALTTNSGGSDTSYRIGSKEYLRSYWTDGIKLASAPARWDGEDWLKAGVVLGVTAGLYTFDARIQNWSQKNRNERGNSSDDVAVIFKNFWDEAYLFPGLAALYVYGHIADSERARATTMLSLQSWFYSSVVTEGLKLTVHRHRPNTGDAYDRFDGPGASSSNLSFPSGHASTAFSIATVIANEYDDIGAVPPIAYTAATLAALSRVNDNEHWASDVFFSSACGYFIGKTMIRWHKPDSYAKLIIIPVFDGRNAMVYMDYAF